MWDPPPKGWEKVGKAFLRFRCTSSLSRGNKKRGVKIQHMGCRQAQAPAATSRAPRGPPCSLQPLGILKPGPTFHQRVIGELFGVGDIPPTLALQLQEHRYRPLDLHLVVGRCPEHNGILGWRWERDLVGVSESSAWFCLRGRARPSVPVYERLWGRSPQRLAIHSRHPHRTEPQCHLQRKARLSHRETLQSPCVYPEVAPHSPPALQSVSLAPERPAASPFCTLSQSKYTSSPPRTDPAVLSIREIFRFEAPGDSI